MPKTIDEAGEKFIWELIQYFHHCRPGEVENSDEVA